MRYSIIFVICLIYFLMFDFIWLSIMSGVLYKPMIGHLMSDKPNLLPAVIFYLIFVLGLSVFVVIPSISNAYPVSKTILFALLFGAVTYSTYDLTNQATLKHWPVLVTVIDIAWGSVLCVLVAVLGLLTVKKFL